MKTVIPAAGFGSRLNNKIPKCLSRITSSKTILDFQIEKLSKKIGIENIIIVVGYQKNMIIEKFPNLNFVFNKEYSKTNTSKSWLLGLQKIEHDDVIIMDSDVFFEEGVLDMMIKSNQSCYLVDKKMCSGDETKYNLNKEGTIHELGKNVKNPAGEALRIRLIKKEDLNSLREKLSKVEDNAFGDEALGYLTVDKKITLKPIFVGDFFCMEVSRMNDLELLKNKLQGL